MKKHILKKILVDEKGVEHYFSNTKWNART